MFEIIDNLLTESYLRDLQNYFLSQECEWNYNSTLTNDDSFSKHGSVGFVIKLHWNQMFLESYSAMMCRALILSARDKVTEITKTQHLVVRARADMTLYNPEKYVHEIHVDYPYEHTTAIFYLNSSDGNTLLYDREGKELLAEVEPVENRLLVFDGLMKHTGHSPAEHKSRVLLNMNFMTPDLINQLNEKYNR